MVALIIFLAVIAVVLILVPTIFAAAGAVFASLLDNLRNAILEFILNVFAKLGDILVTILFTPLEILVNTVIKAANLAFTLIGVPIDYFDLTADGVCTAAKAGTPAAVNGRCAG